MTRKLITLVIALALTPLLALPVSASATGPTVTDDIPVTVTSVRPAAHVQPEDFPQEDVSYGATFKFQMNGTGYFTIQKDTEKTPETAGAEKNICTWPGYCATHVVQPDPAYGQKEANFVSFFLTPVKTTTAPNQYNIRSAVDIGSYGGGRGYCLTNYYLNENRDHAASQERVAGLLTCGDNSYTTESQRFTITAKNQKQQTKLNQYMLQAGLNSCGDAMMATCSYSNVKAGHKKWGSPALAAGSLINNATDALIDKSVVWTSESTVETRHIHSATSGWSIGGQIGGTLGKDASWAKASATVTASISNTVTDETQTAVTTAQKYTSTTTMHVPAGHLEWIAVQPRVLPVKTAIDIAYYPTKYEGGRQTDNQYNDGTMADYHIGTYAVDIPVVPKKGAEGLYFRETACDKATMQQHKVCKATYIP